MSFVTGPCDGSWLVVWKFDPVEAVRAKEPPPLSTIDGFSEDQKFPLKVVSEFSIQKHDPMALQENEKKKKKNSGWRQRILNHLS
ncbi:hypothetical protein TWF569_011716 [Orbilia oligospora]|nr:hypothetical protein TWF569_011716 [Orbilia oligospora]